MRVWVLLGVGGHGGTRRWPPSGEPTGTGAVAQVEDGAGLQQRRLGGDVGWGGCVLSSVLEQRLLIPGLVVRAV